MKNQQKQNKSNKSHRQQILSVLHKISWLLFLEGTVSFQGENWQFELKYQPMESEVIVERVEEFLKEGMSELNGEG